MSTYSFKITKGKYQLSLTTTDKDLVVDQFALWVKKASAYASKAPSREGKDILSSRLNAEKELTQRKIDEQLKNMPKPEPVEEQPIAETTESGINEKDLNVFYAPKHETVETEEEQTAGNADFDNVLDKSMQLPQTELSFKPSPSIKKDNAFLNYINGRKVERKIDYLLLTAYYFTQYEQKPRFTLKQLNAKLMQNLALILDHSVLQEAINRDYIECLPDLTGVVGASEYRLTAYGEKILFEEG